MGGKSPFAIIEIALTELYTDIWRNSIPDVPRRELTDQCISCSLRINVALTRRRTMNFSFLSKLFHAFLVSGLLLSLCSCSAIYLNHMQNAPVPPRVAMTIEITDPNQKKIADSLVLALGHQLQVYASEFKKFTLAASVDSADLVLKVRVRQFRILGSDTQTVIEKKRRQGIKVGDPDSVDQAKIARIAAANVAANVIANMITLPLGFATIIVIRDDESVLGGGLDNYSASALACNFKLVAKQKILWEKDTNHKYHLTGPTGEKEQMSVLIRNTIMDIQDRLPQRA